MTVEEMVERFLCPGCVCGGDVRCGHYRPDGSYGHRCEGHVLGTVMLPVGNFALGLPRGFNRPGPRDDRATTRNTMVVRLWAGGRRPEWDRFNVAVWAMERDGFLFVRTYVPRLNDAMVDVVEGGSLAMAPGAVDVGEFADEID